MKNILYSCLAVLVFGLLSCGGSPETKTGSSDTLHHHADSTHHESQAAMYSCPMHPEVTSDKQGTCPKCGMDLQPMVKKQ